MQPFPITGADVVLKCPHYGGKPAIMKELVQHDALALRQRYKYNPKAWGERQTRLASFLLR